MTNQDKMYNHELLLSQQEGVGIIWLVATLGSKSFNRKKEILQVSIPSVCQDIVNPLNQLPLRFSSNLLYGVSLVYGKQIDHFHSEAIQTKTRLSKDLFKKLRVSSVQGVDTEGLFIAKLKLGEMPKLMQDDDKFNIDFGILPDFSDLNGIVEYGGVREYDLRKEVISKSEDTYDGLGAELEFDALAMENSDAPDLQLDFGDMNQHSNNDNSGAITPLAYVDTDFMLGFKLDIGSNNAALSQETRQAQEPQAPSQPLSQEELKIEKPAKAVRLPRIQVDKSTIMLTTSQLRNQSQHYIPNQVEQIGEKFKKKICTLEPAHFSSESLEEFERTVLQRHDYGLGNIGLHLNSSTADGKRDEEYEIERGRARRSSSITTIEMARRASFSETSRSRLNSDSFQIQDDFMHAPDHLDFDTQMELQDDQLTSEDQLFLSEFHQRLVGMKHDFEMSNRPPLVKFEQLVDSDESGAYRKRQICQVFTGLLELASSSKCDLRNNSTTGSLEIEIF